MTGFAAGLVTVSATAGLVAADAGGLGAVGLGDEGAAVEVVDAEGVVAEGVVAETIGFVTGGLLPSAEGVAVFGLGASPGFAAEPAPASPFAAVEVVEAGACGGFSGTLGSRDARISAARAVPV